jgi:hypothetical protein
MSEVLSLVRRIIVHNGVLSPRIRGIIVFCVVKSLRLLVVFATLFYRRFVASSCLRVLLLAHRVDMSLTVVL